MPTKIKYDLRPYIEAVRVFRHELVAHADAQKDFPIAKIFKVLPTVVLTPGGQRSIENRGNGLFDFKLGPDGATFTNDSLRPEADKITFSDDCLGAIETTLSKVMTFSYKGGDNVELIFSDGVVVVSKIERLSQLPKEVVEKLFPLRLVSVSISPMRMATKFKDKQGSDFTIDGFVPLATSQPNLIQKCVYTWEVYSWTNDYNAELCRIQKSYEEKPSDSAVLQGQFSTREKAKEWTENNRSFCKGGVSDPWA